MANEETDIHQMWINWREWIIRREDTKITDFFLSCSKENQEFWVNCELPLTGSTLLHYVAHTANMQLMSKITVAKCGANFSKKNQMGETPLHVLACSKGHSRGHKEMMARLFLTDKDFPVNPLTRDIWGRRAVDLLPPNEQDLRKNFLGTCDEDFSAALSITSDAEGDDTEEFTKSKKIAPKKGNLKNPVADAVSPPKNAWESKAILSSRSRKISNMFSKAANIPNHSREVKQAKRLTENVLLPQPLYYTNCTFAPISRSIHYPFPSHDSRHSTGGTPFGESDDDGSDFEMLSLSFDHRSDRYTAIHNQSLDKSVTGSNFSRGRPSKRDIIKNKLKNLTPSER